MGGEKKYLVQIKYNEINRQVNVIKILNNKKYEFGYVMRFDES